MNGEIPIWQNSDNFNFESPYAEPKPEQLKFFNKFRKNFEQGIYIDVGGMGNYILYYIYTLKREYEKDKNLEELRQKYKLLRIHYHPFAELTVKIETDVKIELFSYNQEQVDHILKHEQWNNMLRQMQKKVPPRIKNVNEEGLFDILDMGFAKRHLTKFGKKNLEEILRIALQFIREIEEIGDEAYSNRFFDYGKHYKVTTDDKIFDPNYLKMFFDHEEEFKDKLAEHLQRQRDVPIVNKQFPKYYPSVLIFALSSTMRRITRAAEDQLRTSRGLPKIGEGWISETELFYKIKNTFKEEKVVHHGKTKWLGRQHFDIYFPKLNIAVEYQGKQHTEAVDYFGGEEAFQKGLKNDRRKKEKCQKNNCILIEVFPNYDFEEVKAQLEKAIFIKKTKI